MMKPRKPGLFGVSEDFSEDFLSLDNKLIKHPESTYFFRASNDSLRPEILQNDILIVDRSRKPKQGDFVILYHDGERLCKRWPCELEDAEVFGTITATLRER
ncbi:MAG: hypothetical protein COW01_16380 [Bdellovibrionales bacterium CG12_big_fil_rev_8_21_14_0_65_38_15]|nr:MAG: hypothetical protein COW79_00530 [Bdellovibrionales bacterium CG22_combo_CG10-13_8_21_14_all_38_13]PIQ52280.1 MAG: hypothetical protein COW01_16380 [Bdellovibrionales bacterium CG12_big_fil_rev_8_21_14_0_65_38_15]PIR29809.1 MAG: hypothetical protein COV38_08845 [Bdellovibrionales bacterium CG11_big_fil_rev_8_21_14_0_20_38_13]